MSYKIWGLKRKKIYKKRKILYVFLYIFNFHSLERGLLKNLFFHEL